MRRGVWVGLLVLVCAPAVQARLGAATPPDTYYAGQTDQGLPGYVAVLPKSEGVRAAITYQTSCSAGDGSIVWSGVAKAPIRKGHFHYVRKEDAKGPQITLDGQLTSAGVTGTWQVHFSTRNKIGTVTDICDSGKVSFSLPRDGAGGQSVQGFPVALRLGPRLVKSMQFTTQVNCKSGDMYVIPTFYDNITVAKNGTFKKTITDEGVPNKGVHSKLSVQVQGTLRRGLLHGTWHMAAVFTDSSGKQVDTCDSGQLSWTATA